MVDLLARGEPSLLVRCRPDLIVRAIVGDRGLEYVVKEPIGIQFLTLSAESWWVLSRLNGRFSAQRLRREFEAEFPSQTLTSVALDMLIARFHHQGLVVSPAGDQGRSLFNLARADRARRLKSVLANPLAIRIPGINPDRFFTYIIKSVHWFWKPATLFLGISFIIGTLCYGLVQFDMIHRKLRFEPQYISANRWLLFGAALMVSKILHELGHALTCKYFGRACPEMGILVLLFSPCLYCDVSDAWMLTSRWKRVAVGLAGIWVDLLVASAAAWLWWWSIPGTFHDLCGSLVIVCSIATLAFNANPLMRFDGYYVVSDLLQIPNLGPRADWLWQQLMRRLFFGESVPLEERGWIGMALVAYGAASFVWRGIVLVLVLFVMARGLEPLGMEFLAVIFGGAVIAASFFPIIRRAIQKGPPSPEEFGKSRWRRRFSVLVFLVLLVVGVTYPLPYSVLAPVVLEPTHADSVYVQVAGVNRWNKPAGSTVERGEVIAELTNPDLELELEKLRTDCELKRLKLQNLVRRQGENAVAAAEIPTATQAVLGSERRLAELQQQQTRLSIRATRSGVILPPPEIPTAEGARKGGSRPLKRWTRSPLDKGNVGAFLEVGTLLCQIGDPSQLSARVYVSQDDIEFVETNVAVDILLDKSPHRQLRGTLIEMARIETEEVPPTVAIRLGAPVEDASAAGTQSSRVNYQGRIEFQHRDGESGLIREWGEARIATPGVSLLRRGWLWLGRTFGLDRWRGPRTSS